MPIGQRIDLSQVKVYPLDQRESLTSVDQILVDPTSQPDAIPDTVKEQIDTTVRQIRTARDKGSSVMLIYGAHLLRNGAATILDDLMERGLITHLATNGAGTIHDWEYAWLGRSTESVRKNVATGTFGTWEETGRNLHLAILAGGIDDLGYGESLGRFIHEDGVTLPSIDELKQAIASAPEDSRTPARAELLQAMRANGIAGGRHEVKHTWKDASIVALAYKHGVPLTVHPGIGYDIISNHPMFNGAAIGRAAQVDFTTFAGSVNQLDHGVVLSIGSAIMGPQVFEKTLSCANNLRLQQGQPIVHDHSIQIVDLQPGDWDWSQGEPPKTNPAYYLRFCKTYARMGGEMRYACCDNLAFIHHLYHALA